MPKCCNADCNVELLVFEQITGYCGHCDVEREHAGAEKLAHALKYLGEKRAICGDFAQWDLWEWYANGASALILAAVGNFAEAK